MRSCKYPRRTNSKSPGPPALKGAQCAVPNHDASPETTIRFYQSQTWITWLTIWPFDPKSATKHRASKPASGSIQQQYQYKANNTLQSQSISITHRNPKHSYNPIHSSNPPSTSHKTIQWQSARATKRAVATTGPNSNSTYGLWSCYHAQQHVWVSSPGSWLYNHKCISGHHGKWFVFIFISIQCGFDAFPEPTSPTFFPCQTCYI